MQFTITSPNNCGHITIETDKGEVFHTHIDDLLGDNEKPYALELIKREIVGKTVADVLALKAEIEGKVFGGEVNK